MSKITKDKFIIELGKLLAFMSDDDRETAVAMYGKMFELAQNDDALISFLVSPTRQAVQLARVYNANDKKLSYYSDPNYDEEDEETEDGTSQYIERIKEIFSDALDAIPAQNEAEKAEKQLKDATESLEKIADMKGVPNHIGDDYVRIYGSKEETKKVDDFMNEFRITEPSVIASADNEITEEVEPAVQDNNPPEESADKTVEKTDIETAVETDVKLPEDNKTENAKLSGGALALFLLIAIPLTALALIIEFIVAIGFLALAAAAGIMCFRIIEAAFGSFRVFADVLAVTGTGFILGALAILFLWTAIYLVFGVSKYLVNGIVNLAIKICSKEAKQ